MEKQYHGAYPQAIPAGRCTSGRRARFSHEHAVFPPAAVTPSRLRSIFIATGNACTTCYWSTLVIAALPLQPSTSGSPRKYRHSRSLYPVNAISGKARQSPGSRQEAKKEARKCSERLLCLLGEMCAWWPEQPRKKTRVERYRSDGALQMSRMQDSVLVHYLCQNFPANPGRLHIFFPPLRLIYEYGAAGFVRRTLDEASAGNIRLIVSFSWQPEI